MNVDRPSFLVALVLSCAWVNLQLASTIVLAATPEVRGTWLTTTGPDHIRTGLSTETVLADLRQIGLNTVYTETWKNGYTNYPSPTLKALIGTTDRNPVIGSSRDLVQETLINAHRQGLVYYGWFEYGVMSQYIGAGGNPNNPLSNYMKSRGWLLQNQNGEYADSTNGGFAFMNLTVPEVRQFIVDITLEAVNRYDLDGIQFDDHMAWPENFGFDSTTLGLYTSETGNSVPTSPTNSQFRAWRQQKVTSFASELYSAVKSARPDIKVSVSPSITPFSSTNYNANWPQWESQGLFDEFAVQMYRDNLTAFNGIVPGQVSPFEPNDMEKLVFGLRINGSGASTPFADLQAMIERSRAEGVAGHSLWYSSGVRDLYKQQLTTLYDVAQNGQAPNPNFAVDHRPTSLVGTKVGTNQWDFDVAQADRYRIIAKLGNYWTEFNVAQLSAGIHRFSVPTASAVELLIDRRSASYFLGDFDGDSTVDGKDFIIWQRHVGQTANVRWWDGDANLDGKVDAADLARWQQNYGWSETIVPEYHSIPEPTAMVIAALIVSPALFLRGSAVFKTGPQNSITKRANTSIEVSKSTALVTRLLR